MFKFSQRSLRNLLECHPDIQEVFFEVIRHYDCSIIEGFRGRDEQNRAYMQKKSKLRFPDSKHNWTPSLAVDVIFFPFADGDWYNYKKFYHFAGFVLGVAASKGISMRWGGDWDSDRDFKDQNFHDLPHFELYGDKYGDR